MLYFRILFLSLTVFTVASCSQEDTKPSLCPDGNCDGQVFINSPKDSNGYYHVNLDFGGEILPRFDIFIEADDVDPFYYYNDTSVVLAAFQSDTIWELPNGLSQTIVQESTLYLNNSTYNNEYTTISPGRKWAKRIIGPIPQEFIGDTLVIRAELYWDGGSNSKSQFLEEKIIIE